MPDLKTLKLSFLFVLFPVLLFAQKAGTITAPAKISKDEKRIKIFLGGSIEMGKAENWQKWVEEQLSDQQVVLLNPRRNDWNDDWKPNADNPHFREQVEWELEALESADIIMMYFAPNTLSPVSMLELGLYARTGKLMVVCPEGFWRKGNVDIVSERYQISIFESLEELIGALKIKIAGFN